MADTLIPAGMGLTVRMKQALDAIIAHVSRHGVMPSRSALAREMNCSKGNAARVMTLLMERGELSSATKGGPLTGFGACGVQVAVPADIAARLAAFCTARDERLSAVVADALLLHLDELEGEVE